MHIVHRLCILFAALSRSCSTKLPIIRNSNRPVCSNCVHFTLHDAHFPNTILNHEYGKCKVFGTMDIVTGNIIYDYASLCRKSESKCGMKGTYHEEKVKEDPK